MNKMNKNKGKRGKFLELNLDQFSKNKDPKKEELKNFQEIETELEILEKLFPNLEFDLVENIYEDNLRNFNKTKKLLEEMCQGEDSNQNECENSEKNEVVDINAFARFRYDDPFIDNSTNNIININEGENLEVIKKKKFLIVDCNNVNNILAQQKKDGNDYVSVFDTTNEINEFSNNLTPKINNKIQSTPIPTNMSNNYNEYYLEQIMLEYYIDILIEFFPKYSRMEITEKICEYDYDIDKLILDLFQEGEDLNFDFAKFESSELDSQFKQEILSNFYPENHLQYDSIFQHNLQSKIEKDIKKNNLYKNLSQNNKAINLMNENDFPFLSDDVKEEVLNDLKISDEYFLDKDVKDIKNSKIKEELVKLIKNFPLKDEFEIKWVYFQFMDYYETYKYLNSKCTNGGKNIKMPNFCSNNSDGNNKISNEKNNLSSIGFKSMPEIKQQNQKFTDVLYKIISEKPQNWKLSEGIQEVKVNEYQEIRRKLLQHAQLAWRSGRHNDAKVIMAKARRYKQEINTLINSKKLSLFAKNNEDKQLYNLISNKENFIDLHGLSYEESKIIVSKKVSDIMRKKNEGELQNDKRFTLHVVTGLGTHSKDKRPVLLPRLTALFKQQKFFFKVDEREGTIKVFL
jgi:hypothetical protein